MKMRLGEIQTNTISEDFIHDIINSDINLNSVTVNLYFREINDSNLLASYTFNKTSPMVYKFQPNNNTKVTKKDTYLLVIAIDVLINFRKYDIDISNCMYVSNFYKIIQRPENIVLCRYVNREIVLFRRCCILLTNRSTLKTGKDIHTCIVLKGLTKETESLLKYIGCDHYAVYSGKDYSNLSLLIKVQHEVDEYLIPSLSHLNSDSAITIRRSRFIKDLFIKRKNNQIYYECMYSGKLLMFHTLANNKTKPKLIPIDIIHKDNLRRI